MSDVEQCKHPACWWTTSGEYRCSRCGDVLNTAFDCHFSDIRKEIEALGNYYAPGSKFEDVLRFQDVIRWVLFKLEEKYGRSK